MTKTAAKGVEAKKSTKKGSAEDSGEGAKEHTTTKKGNAKDSGESTDIACNGDKKTAAKAAVAASKGVGQGKQNKRGRQVPSDAAAAYIEGACESNGNTAATAPGASEPAVATPTGTCESKGDESSGGCSDPSGVKRQRVSYVTALKFDPFYRVGDAQQNKTKNTH